MKLKVHGCRGSIATFGNPCSRYGSNTSCITIESKNRTLVLDAGSGLCQYERELKAKSPNYINELKSPVDILISHLHLDHIIGLTTFSPCWNPSSGVRLFTCNRDHRELKEQIFGAFAPPYWPASMAEKAVAECVAIEDKVPFTLPPFIITPFYATHPDDTYSFHITDGEKTLVHLLDTETQLMNEESYSTLVEYCKGVDLVIFDAAYTPTDYPQKIDWGHSTIEDGLKLAEASGCKQILFSHFSYEYTDNEIDELVHSFKHYGNRFLFAYDGMEMELI